MSGKCTSHSTGLPLPWRQMLIFAAQQLDDTTAVHEAARASLNWILTSMGENRPLNHIVNAGAGYEIIWGRTAGLTCLFDPVSNRYKQTHNCNTVEKEADQATTTTAATVRVWWPSLFCRWIWIWYLSSFRLVHRRSTYAGLPLLLCSGWTRVEFSAAVSHLESPWLGGRVRIRTSRHPERRAESTALSSRSLHGEAGSWPPRPSGSARAKPSSMTGLKGCVKSVSLTEKPFLEIQNHSKFTAGCRNSR